MRLMIVDDSLIIRNKISRSLLVKFSKVSRAENGEQALKMVRAEKPDVVTMDLTMPKVGGVEAIKKMMEIEPTIHILVVSALADKATAIKALTYGANGFLCKPFTDVELNEAIEQILKIKLSS